MVAKLSQRWRESWILHVAALPSPSSSRSLPLALSLISQDQASWNSFLVSCSLAGWDTMMMPCEGERKPFAWPSLRQCSAATNTKQQHQQLKLIFFLPFVFSSCITITDGFCGFDRCGDGVGVDGQRPIRHRSFQTLTLHFKQKRGIRFVRLSVMLQRGRRWWASWWTISGFDYLGGLPRSAMDQQIVLLSLTVCSGHCFAFIWLMETLL